MDPATIREDTIMRQAERRLRRWTERVVLALILVCFCDAATLAKSSPAYDQHITDAQRFYGERNYDRAIEEFDAAYKLDPEPLLLVSMGRCHYLADRPKAALDLYQQALKAKLTRSERDEVMSSIAKATIKLQEQQRREAEAQRVADQARMAELLAQQQAAQPPPEKPVYKKAWFWGIIGGVAVATGLAIGLSVGLRPQSMAMPMEMPTDIIN
jgi:tetratricopeptide (TPR) repeat protein